MRFRPRSTSAVAAWCLLLLTLVAIGWPTPTDTYGLRPTAYEGQASAGTAGSFGGTLIAVFVTRASIILCSDGRVVRSPDGAVVSETWSKVHRVTNRVGMLTGGRHLSRLLPSIERRLATRPSPVFAEAVAAVEGSLRDEWSALPIQPDGRPEGRSFVYVSGFDERGEPRLVSFDSGSRPLFRAQEIRLFDGQQDLEIAAIATSSGPHQDVSAVLAQNLRRIQQQAPELEYSRTIAAAFNGAKTELAAGNSRIGGHTYMAGIARDTGFGPIAVMP